MLDKIKNGTIINITKDILVEMINMDTNKMIV